MREGKNMKLNVGPIDSVIRILIGVTLLSAALMSYVGAWGYIGVIFIASGLARFCPFYKLCKINTNSGQGAAL
jgi:uncharacterized membrane protein HdeD (DUF308 family)